MRAWLARAIARRPVLFLVGNLAVAVATGALALAAPDRLVVADGLARADSGKEQIILTLTPRGAVSDSVTREAVAVIESGLVADPTVVAVTTGDARRAGEIEVLVEIAAETEAAQQEAAEGVAELVDPGPFRVEATGQAVVLADAREEVSDELPGLALLAAPVVILVIGFAFGPRLALAPMLAAATASFGAIAALGLLPESLGLSATGIAVAVAVGLAVAIEASFVVRTAHREASFDSQAAMLAEALGSSAPRVVWGGLGAAVAAGAVFAIPVSSSSSAALGGIAAALLATASARIAMASLFALVPPKPTPEPEPASGALRERVRSGRIGAVVDEIALRPALALIPAIAVLAGLGALTYPAFDAQAIALAGPPEAASSVAELFRARLGWVLGAVTAVGLAAAYLATRSARLAIARGIGSALAAGATCGLLELVVEGEPPVVEAVGAAPYASTFLAVVAALGAVGVARGALGDRRAALAGTLVAGPALGVLAGIELDAVAQVGVAIAAGLAIDLVLVRAVLVPCLERGLPLERPGLPRPRLPRVPRPRLPDRFRR